MTARRSRLTGSAKIRLVAIMNGEVVGNVYQMANGQLAFRYEESWRHTVGAFPLSLSMPLTAAEHGDQSTRAYLWGLLPDNPDVLEWWARRYGISRHRVVELLARVGEDCAGAVQFATPERAHDLMTTAHNTSETESVEWLGNNELELRLRDLRLNPAAGRSANDTGQFSLAGAQPKTALYQSADGKWGVPSGRVPTNRILKPPTLGLDDLAYNEHFCLSLARELGFSAAASRVQQFGDEVAIVLERYDRVVLGDRLVRVHQEDMCQALAVRPTQKYESEGGPGVIAIENLLRQSSSDPAQDTSRFVDATAFNWLIAGTDAHAKNYSILHAAGPQLRLAPLYDVISALPYQQLKHSASTLAMAIGGERRISAIHTSHWQTLARETGLPTSEMVERVRAVAKAIPDAIERLTARQQNDVALRRTFEKFGLHVASHVTACMKRLGG